MDSGMILQLVFSTFILAAKLAAPLLLTALVVGLLVGLFQAVTQINDSTLGFLPKVIAVAVALVLVWPWLQTEMVEYTQHIFSLVERSGR